VKKTDYPHNTAEQVRGYIEGALELVDELDPPTDLREHVFVKACDLLSSKQVILEQTALGALPSGLLRQQ